MGVATCRGLVACDATGGALRREENDLEVVAEAVTSADQGMRSQARGWFLES